MIPVPAPCDETMDPSQVKQTDIFFAKLSRNAQQLIESDVIEPPPELIRFEGPYHLEGPGFPYMRVI